LELMVDLKVGDLRSKALVGQETNEIVKHYHT